MLFTSFTNSNYKYVVKHDLLKWIPNMKIYAGLANAETLYWDALSGLAKLETVGNYDNTSWCTSNAVK